ncbi:hypothetical protein HAX54_052900 [Datura stramonium]|uniref:Uncharacterized protein n=1 Tax=Datura stramonium TaxID=4076 RepID=A0ABS8WRM5_DATST|nr:hypothetical protein [Datura stramonium]
MLRYNLRSKSKITEYDESNTAANVLVSIKNPESSQRRADVRNDEQMDHLEEEYKELKEELCQVRDLTRLNVATFSHLLHFPSLETPNPEHFPKSVLRTAPNLSLPNQVGTMSTYPTTQHRTRAHVETSYDAHVPPVYTFETPTYTTPVTVRVLYEVDQYTEMEKDARIKEEDSITSQLDSLKRALKTLQIT